MTTRIPSPAVRGSDRHHLYVIGPNTREVIGCLGGWLFDRAMAGWEVTVFNRELDDVRPLRILGAHADDFGSAVAAVEGCLGHPALAVAADVYDDDASVRRLVGDMLRGRRSEVTVWGDVRSKGLHRQLSVRSYRLGPAAAAFKMYALAATTMPAASNRADPEVFHSNRAEAAQRAMIHARQNVS